MNINYEVNKQGKRFAVIHWDPKKKRENNIANIIEMIITEEMEHYEIRRDPQEFHISVNNREEYEIFKECYKEMKNRAKKELWRFQNE